jgi:hypothetical protein
MGAVWQKKKKKNGNVSDENFNTFSAIDIHICLLTRVIRFVLN